MQMAEGARGSGGGADIPPRANSIPGHPAAQRRFFISPDSWLYSLLRGSNRSNIIFSLGTWGSRTVSSFSQGSLAASSPPRLTCSSVLTLAHLEGETAEQRALLDALN